MNKWLASNCFQLLSVCHFCLYPSACGVVPGEHVTRRNIFHKAWRESRRPNPSPRSQAVSSVECWMSLLDGWLSWLKSWLIELSHFTSVSLINWIVLFYKITVPPQVVQLCLLSVIWSEYRVWCTETFWKYYMQLNTIFLLDSRVHFSLIFLEIKLKYWDHSHGPQ